MSVYVDSAATGAADGTSWTDAFTTIQAAITSLPTVLEHAVTIYVRKGSITYDENVVISQITGKGSLTIRGEYYWSGPCAAASTPATNKFQVADTTGMLAGDTICIINVNTTGSAPGGAGTYNYYTYTTIASVDSETQLTLTDSCDWGNIGTNDMYTICRTALSGRITVTNSRSISIIGIITSGEISISSGSAAILDSVFSTVTGTAIFLFNLSSLTLLRSYINGSSNSCYVYNGGLLFLGTYNTPTSSCVVIGICYIRFSSSGQLSNTIFNRQSGNALIVNVSSGVYLTYCTICSGTTIGITATGNSAIQRATVNNNATTPLSPATSIDNPVII
jgi:hypothetical protein